MAFTYVGGAANRSTGTASLSVTHGLTINAGDLAVAYINVNGPQTASIDSGGSAWTEALNTEVSGETTRHALWWKICGASEPSSYSFTIGSSDNCQAIVKVFRPGSGNTAVVDATVNAPDRTGSSARDMIINAIDGEVISNGAVSVAFGGKDNRSGTQEDYTSAGSSYTGLVGDNTGQAAVGIHRIYTTGTTFSGSVTVETADGNDGVNDRTYSVHMSFVESASSSTDDLLADDVESASEVTSPALGQEHALTATSVESASEVSSPTLAEVSTTDELLADDVESASEVTSPALGQEHALTADDVESASEVTAPALAQVQALTADDVESASEVTAPALAERHNLTSVSVESASEVTAPALGQTHVLTADSVESASETTSPAISTDGTDGLLAEDVESASEVTAPVIGQTHALVANDVQSLSEVSVPALNGASAPDLPPARRRFRPVWEMTGPTPT